MRKKKQILSLLLSMGLFASMFPANALAAQVDAEQIDGNIASLQSDETREGALTTDISISAEVNGQKVLPQSVGDDVYWFLPASADLTRLSVTGNATLQGSIANREITIGNTAEEIDLNSLFGDIQPGIAYPLTVYNNTYNASENIKVMQADNVDTLFITLENTTLAKLHESKTNEGEGTAVMVTSDGVQLNKDITRNKIKGRGNSSWLGSGEKRPYNITLDKKAELINGAGEAKKWCLISDNCNGTWVHEAAGLANAAAYDMYDAIDGKYPMAHKFINLYIDGEYRGVYMITEKVEINANRVAINESKYSEEDKNSRTLIKKSGAVDPYPLHWQFVSTESAVIDDEDIAIRAGIQTYEYATHSKEKKSGGYLLELDRGFNEEASWFVTRRGYPYVLKEPEFASKEQVQQIAMYVQAAEDAVFAENGYNAEGKYYTDYFDLDSLAKKVAIDLTSFQCDAFVTSCYFSVDLKNDDLGKILAGPAWDFDGSWYAGEGLPNLSNDKYDEGAVLNSHMVQIFFKHGDFTKAFTELSEGALKSAWESEKSKIADYVQDLNASYEMNKILWPKGNSGATTDYTDPNALSAFQTQFSNRYVSWYNTVENSKLLGVSVMQDGNLLKAEVSGSASGYQWVKLNDDLSSTAIDGATESMYAPKENGRYYCIATGDSIHDIQVPQMWSAAIEFISNDYDPNKETPDIDITATPDTLTGGGAVELTISGAPEEGLVNVSCDHGITVNKVEGKYTATLPNKTQQYTFTAAYTGTAVYNNAADTCAVTVTYKDNGSSAGGSAGGGGGGGAVAPASSTNEVIASTASNGKVSLDKSTAKKGDTVTVTVSPDAGYQLDKLTVTYAKGNIIEVTKKSDGKYTFTMPDSKVTINSVFVKTSEAVSENPFADIRENDYFFDAVKWAADKEITNGLTVDRFAPDDGCTRAQIVTFLWRAAGAPEPSTLSNFTDVPANKYYAKAVAWAIENGVTNGISENIFGPDDICTRAHSVAFLYRATKASASGSSTFADVDTNAYYAAAVKWATDNGITNGMSAERFGPDETCTRAQIVTFLWRLYQDR